MKSPIIHSGDITWAPSGIAYLNGKLYFAGLRGEALYEAEISDKSIQEVKTHFKSEFGRLRAVVFHDGYLYITTSNRDGRGSVRGGDDKIIKMPIP